MLSVSHNPEYCFFCVHAGVAQTSRINSGYRRNFIVVWCCLIIALCEMRDDSIFVNPIPFTFPEQSQRGTKGNRWCRIALLSAKGGGNDIIQALSFLLGDVYHRKGTLFLSYSRSSLFYLLLGRFAAKLNKKSTRHFMARCKVVF